MAPIAVQPAELWLLTDHVCRGCYGRILRTESGPGHPPGEHRYRCSNCALEARSRDEHSLCACGTKLKSGRDAGIRCRRHEQPTPEFPSEVVAKQVDDDVLTSSQGVKHRFTNGGAPLFETSA